MYSQHNRVIQIRVHGQSFLPLANSQAITRKFFSVDRFAEKGSKMAVASKMKSKVVAKRWL